MICTSIGEKGYDACRQALGKIKFGEIRLDKAKLEPEGIRKIFSSGKKLVATYHAGEESEQARAAALRLAIESGAAYVDIPIESSNGFKAEIIEVAKANDCTVIISYHNFKETPDTEELLGLIDSAFAQGADIAKVACMVNSPEDNERLLSLLDGKRRMIVIGMGELGTSTRADAIIRGAEFTFASLGTGKELAPGQVDQETLERMIAERRAKHD
jgi:3-dehydroquinate dehydratase type I